MLSSFVIYCQIYSIEFCTNPRTREASGWNSCSPAPSSPSQPFAMCLACKTPHWDFGLSRNVWDTPSMSFIGWQESRGWNKPLLLVCKVLKAWAVDPGDLCSLTTLPTMCSSQEDGCTLVKVSHSLNLGQTLKQIWASLLPQEETWFLHELDVKISRAWLTSPPNSNCKGKTQRAWASGMTKMRRGKWGFLSPLQEPERHMLLRTWGKLLMIYTLIK